MPLKLAILGLVNSDVNVLWLVDERCRGHKVYPAMKSCNFTQITAGFECACDGPCYGM